jgi:Ran GTPase-activating protein (RanGAP) involved in mRNA processing and transport
MAEILTERLADNVASDELNLASLEINDTDAATIAKAVETNTTWKTLCLRSNYIGSPGVIEIVHSLQKNKTLERIDLRRNLVDHDGAQAVVQYTDQTDTRVEFLLGGNRIGDRGLHLFAKHIDRWYTLDLSDNDISVTGVAPLANALERQPSLVSLTLNDNPQISDLGMRCLANALMRNTTLHTLALSRCNLTDESMIDLAKLLEHVSCSLTSLNIGKNPIGDEGVMILGGALIVNSSLKALYVNDVQRTDQGVLSLATALTRNRALMSLDIRDTTSLTYESTRALSRALSIQKTLTSLHVIPPVHLNDKQDLCDACEKRQCEERQCEERQCEERQCEERQWQENIIHDKCKCQERKQEKVAFQELKQIMEDNVNRLVCWQQIGILVGFVRANRDHVLVNSIQPLIPVILNLNIPFAKRRFGWPRVILERYLDTKHCAAQLATRKRNVVVMENDL